MDYSICDRVLPSYFRSYPEGGNQTLAVSREMDLRFDKIVALHHHSSFEIGFCLAGSGNVQVEDRIYRFKAGDITFIRAYQPHYSASDPGTGSRWIWVYFNPKLLFADIGMPTWTNLDKLCSSGFTGVFCDEELPVLSAICRRFLETARNYDKDELNRYEIAFLCGELLVDTIKAADTDIHSHKYVYRVDAAVRFISTHFADCNAMRENVIAEHCNISQSYLRLLFKRETGLSPRSFILHTRLAAAANMLITTNHSILEISLQCGFNQVTSFNRAFRKHYDCTPGEFRKFNT